MILDKDDVVQQKSLLCNCGSNDKTILHEIINIDHEKGIRSTIVSYYCNICGLYGVEYPEYTSMK